MLSPFYYNIVDLYSKLNKIKQQMHNTFYKQAVIVTIGYRLTEVMMYEVFCFYALNGRPSQFGTVFFFNFKHFFLLPLNQKLFQVVPCHTIELFLYGWILFVLYFFH